MKLILHEAPGAVAFDVVHHKRTHVFVLAEDSLSVRSTLDGRNGLGGRDVGRIRLGQVDRSAQSGCTLGFERDPVAELFWALADAHDRERHFQDRQFWLAKLNVPLLHLIRDAGAATTYRPFAIPALVPSDEESDSSRLVAVVEWGPRWREAAALGTRPVTNDVEDVGSP